MAIADMTVEKERLLQGHAELPQWQACADTPYGHG